MSAAAPQPEPPALRIDGLKVRYGVDGASLAAVRDVSLQVSAGECLGIVGESGSGKSQVFLAALGLLTSSARIEGSVRFDGEELLGLSAAATQPDSRREALDGVSGPDDLAHSAYEDRRAARRSAGASRLGHLARG